MYTCFGGGGRKRTVKINLLGWCCEELREDV
jgi:hypothetical protein